MRRKNYILLTVCGVLAVSSIFMTIESATSGLAVAKFEEKEIELLDEKRNLEEVLVKTLSVTELQEKSGEMGFAKPADLVYVAQTPPVAKLP